MALTAAQAWSVKPTVFLRDWSSRDQELAKSLILHKESLHTCGQPIQESTDPDGPEYEVDDDVCRACGLLEEAYESPSTEKGHFHFVRVRRPPRTSD